MNSSTRKGTLLIFLIISCVLLVSPATCYTVAIQIKQGAPVYIGEEGLNLTPAQFSEYYGKDSTAPLAGVVDQNAATIGWWSSVANIQTTAPSKTLSLVGRNTSFTVSPSDI